ncbi:hypothetical protein VTL71DRAFT_210 [Oculimacula yallundae]|uniref:MYND-type domain-containing protein n=1 Tax=Oculimacula yallundae TaxID=86028 RepID=A0ABR4CZE5_9HELO
MATTQIPGSFCCANNGDCLDGIIDTEAHCQSHEACEKKASNTCTQCYLVQYCSKECQKSHWAIHKLDCKSALMKQNWLPSWEVENRSPSFIEGGGGVEPNNGPSLTVHGTRKYLWGNVPAYDVLNLRENEGVETKRDLRLVFAASGDMRNVAKTVVGLPDSYPGNCDLVLNDMDPSIVIRNAILLLTALTFPPEEAAPMMLHIWYSALLPASTFLSLQEKILPLVQDVCTKIQGKAGDSLQAKTWTFSHLHDKKSSLRIILKKSQWETMMVYFRVPAGLGKVEAQRVRKATTLAPERLDYVHRGLYALKPARRVGMMKFRGDGILLPFGAPRRGYDVPNPTLFQSKDFWPMMDSADPLHGWSTSDIRANVPLASNDVYGGLYFHVYSVLLKFCNKLQVLNLSFVLLQVNALELYKTLENAQLLKQGFDRVEVSNISDGGYIGIQRTLLHLSRLLPAPPSNPHATLLTLFLNAIHEISSSSSFLSSPTSLKSDITKLLKYLPLPNPAKNPSETSAYMMDLIQNRSVFWDFDTMFATYMQEEEFARIAREQHMCVKETHTVLGKWPWRLREGAPKELFDELRASGLMGSERYVEWRRV